MPSKTGPELTPDEIDDVLYFARINETQDLQQTITELGQKYGCTAKDVLSSSIDSESGNTVLHFVSANGFPELLKALLLQLQGQSQTNGADSNSDSVPPLINKVNGQGNTALHWAAYNGHLDVVKILVDSGADMWVKNSAGHLAFFEAERAEKSDVVQYLLTAGQSSRLAAGRSAEEDAEVDEGVESGAANGAEQNGGVDVVMEEAESSS